MILYKVSKTSASERKPAPSLPCINHLRALQATLPSINPPKVIKPRRLEGSGVVAVGVGTVSTEEIPYKGRNATNRLNPGQKIAPITNPSYVRSIAQSDSYWYQPSRREFRFRPSNSRR
jgi:hypothetical protein